MTEDPSPTPPHWLSWAPLGLWSAGLLAALRCAALLSGARRAGGPAADDARLAWDLAGEYPEVLVQALVVGLTSAALLATARAGGHPGDLQKGEPRPRSRGPYAFAAAFYWSVLSGWPLAPASQRSTLLVEPALDDALVQAGLAILLAVAFGYGLGYAGGGVRGRPRGARRLVAGIPALVLAALVAALGPAAWAWRTASRPPTFARRVVVHDFLEHLDQVRVLDPVGATGGAPEATPELTVITPVVAWETDSGDKPALRMAPPCSVELTVPANLAGPDLYLRAAAGVDKSFFGRIPEGAERVDFEFSIDVNGRRAYATTISCERPTKGRWDPSKRIWHHAGGEVGLSVASGDTLVLRTRLVQPELAAALPPEGVKLGFGELVIERAVEGTRARATVQAPNIVLIVMDTLRADRMSCYGYGRSTTPHLDALASRGILFENAYSTSSWTWPSTASILTGLPADAHGVTSNESCTLVRSLESLPELLQERGYTTAGFSCNPLIAPERYFDQGFEHFVAARDGFWTTDEVAPDILAWMDQNRSLRFFLYLHLADPHTPHHPHEKEARRLGLTQPADLPEGGMEHYLALLTQRAAEPGWDPAALDALVPPEHQRWLSEVYDASVATGDRWVGEFLARLDELGLADRTIVAFTADHGEELLDRASLGHGHTLHQELVHVPLILAGPGIPAGERLTAVVSNRHLAPTLATLGGAHMRAMGDGLFLPDAGDGESAFVQTDKGLWKGEPRQRLLGLRDEDWFLQWRVSSAEVPDVALYQLREDPEEGLDLAATQTEVVARLLAELKRQLAQQESFTPRLRIGAGDAMQEVLEAFGYAGNDER